VCWLHGKKKNLPARLKKRWESNDKAGLPNYKMKETTLANSASGGVRKYKGEGTLSERHEGKTAARAGACRT